MSNDKINVLSVITKVRKGVEKDFAINRDNLGDFLMTYGTRHCHYASTLTSLKLYQAKLQKRHRETRALVENEIKENSGPRLKISQDSYKKQIDLDDRVVDLYDEISKAKIAVSYVEEILEVFKSYRSIASAIKEQMKIEHM